MRKFFWNVMLLSVMSVFSICNISAQEEERTTVFRNVSLIPMTKDTLIKNQTVVVKGIYISAIGNNDTMAIPSGASVIDGEGRYLMPGLADMHVHYLSDYSEQTFFNLFLKNGVTTIRAFQSFPNDSVLDWNEKIKNNKLLGPNMFTCGLFFNDPVIPADEIITAKRNYDFVKLYSGLTKSEFNTIMRVAKKEQVYTIGHIPFLVGLDGVCRARMDEIAHITELDFDLVHYPKLNLLKNSLFAIVYNNWVKDFYSCDDKEAYLSKTDKKLDEIVAKVKNSGMAVNTTLVVTKIINEQLYDKEEFLKRPELPYMLKGFMPDYLAGENTYQKTMSYLMAKNIKLVNGDDGRRFFDTYLNVNRILTKRLHDAGILLLLGTDAPAIVVAVVPGYSVHEELKILTECGLTPYEAIQTGTQNAGIASMLMTGVNVIGTIEVNKQADLILTKNNPLLDVANIKDMDGVMLRGNWFSKEMLDSLEISVKTNLADALLSVTLNNNSAEAIEKKYKEIKADSLELYCFLPDPLNDLGYKLIHQGRYKEAIAVFKILVLEFPDNWMWLDSLGEAYMKDGNKESAIEYYTKSVNLNPQSTSGKSALRKLGIRSF
ncbi:MAG: amidohydrolase family protein [Bacteroidota bacterium]